MGKRCETFDHTADVGLLATADTAAEVFEALAEGLAEYICPRQCVAARGERLLEVKAEDIEALAVDFLCRVLDAIQADRFMVARVLVERLTPNEVRARLGGEEYDPARHEIRTEVKAVTYHLLKVAQEQGRWVGRVVLDL